MLYNKYVVKGYKMVHLVVGPPATKEAFFDREKILERIWKRIEVGNLLLVAPRRFGKTSIMLQMRDFPKDDAIVLYMDIEWISEPIDFITEIISQLTDEDGGVFLEKVKDMSKLGLKYLQSAIEETEISGFKLKLRESLKENWKDKGKELLQVIDTIDKRLIFIVDELPLMVNRMLKKKGAEEVEEFLYWFRAMRISGGLKNIRFVVGGSIGIEHILGKIGAIASVNDLERIQIEAFDNEKARVFTKKLLESEGIEPKEEVVEKILDIVEVNMPYLIQVLIAALGNEVLNLNIETISPELVEEVYQKRVLGVECRTYFEHYYGRIKDYYEDEEAKSAKLILKELSRREKLSKKELFDLYVRTTGKSEDEEGFSHLMTDLENDFYVESDAENGEYGFTTKVLRDWWRKHYGFVD